MAESGYSIVRPIEYNVGRFVPGLTESAVNIFKMEFDPTDFSETRASWQFRSPGLNSLMSSQVFVEFDLLITTPSKYYDFASAVGPNYSMVRVDNTGGNNANDSHSGASVTLAFGEGNPFKACQQSFQLVVNGASLQQTRMDEYSNSIEKLWYPPTVMQRRFGRCGGAWSNWDGVCVSGDGLDAAANLQTDGRDATRARGMYIYGFTQDSSLAKRIQGVLACTKQAPTVENAAGSVRIIRVRCPLEGCGILNPLGRGDQCANSCPLKSGSFVIPHMNVIGVNLLFKNMFKTIIKNLSAKVVGAGGVNVAQFGGSANVAVAFPAGGANAKLCVSYIRLPSWRSIPQTRTLSSYRIAVHDVTSKSVGAGAVTIHTDCLDGPELRDALPVSGFDKDVVGVSGRFKSDRYLEAKWSGVQMSQIPTYLGFVLQKSTDCYTLANTTKESDIIDFSTQGAPAADLQNTQTLLQQGIARNTVASCAIVGLRLQIQSSVGSYEFSSDGHPYLKGRSELFADTLKNSYLEYCDGSEFIWDRHSGIVFLQSCDYARGLSSEGCSFPITIDATVRFENHRQFCDGTGYSTLSATGPAVLQDCIQGRPVMLACYMRQSLAISPSSALVSSQNISHSSGIELLSRQ